MLELILVPYLYNFDHSTGISHLDAMQGTSEARTETYLTYGEGALELVTPQRAKNSRGKDGFAAFGKAVLRDSG